MLQPILQTTEDKFVITIDKNSINKVFLLQLLEKIRLEYLAQQVNFDESIGQLSEEIKASWWEQNKNSFLNGK